MNDKSIDLSVVIPVYFAEASLEELCNRLVKVLKESEKTFEVLFVNDGSSDGSWELLKKLAQQMEEVRAFQLCRNFGQVNATLCGFKHAKGRLVATIDDDLQHSPEDLLYLLEAIETDPNVDIVMGIEKERKHKAWRNYGSRVINWVNGVSYGIPKQIRLSSFRVLRRSIVDAIISMRMTMPAMAPLMYAVTTRIKNVEVEHQERPYGKSGYSLRSLVSLSLTRFLQSSLLPLRFLMIVGMLGVFFSICLSSFYIIRYFFYGVGVQGWTSVMLLLIGILGFNSFGFGIMGEYLYRILILSQSAPQYVVKEEYSTEKRREL